MNKRYSPLILPLACLLILLTAGQGLASGFVLCIGEDGHSAFEESFAGKCAPPAPVHPAAEECSCSAADDHCGPCQDLTLSADSLQTRSRIDVDAPPVAPFLSPPIFYITPTFVRDLTANLSPQPPPQPSTELIALRIVVLLN